jgi:hypothetical protein
MGMADWLAKYMFFALLCQSPGLPGFKRRRLIVKCLKKSGYTAADYKLRMIIAFLHCLTAVTL